MRRGAGASRDEAGALLTSAATAGGMSFLPPGPESRRRRQPSDEGQDGGGEVIVTVARHHMPRAADVDVIGVRYQLEKFLGMRLLHEFGGCAAHKQGRDLNPARGLDQRRFERTAVRSGRARTIEEARIPVPTPAAIGR